MTFASSFIDLLHEHHMFDHIIQGYSIVNSKLCK